MNFEKHMKKTRYVERIAFFCENMPIALSIKKAVLNVTVSHGINNKNKREGMEKIVPLFEEFSAGRDKHLVIVDVQKEFDRWMKPDFIKSVHKYAEQFPNVYQIWDANRAVRPSEKFPNEKMTALKRYGYDLREEDILHHFDNPVQSELKTDFQNKKFEDAQGKRKAYKTRNGELLHFVGKSHQFFMAEQELQKLIEYFKSLKDGVTLCGGADGECLADVEAMLQYYDVPYDLNRDYVYAS